MVVLLQRLRLVIADIDTTIVNETIEAGCIVLFAFALAGEYFFGHFLLVEHTLKRFGITLIMTWEEFLYTMFLHIGCRA